MVNNPSKKIGIVELDQIMRFTNLFAAHAFARDFEVVIDKTSAVFLSALHQQIFDRSLTVEYQVNVTCKIISIIHFIQ